MSDNERDHRTPEEKRVQDAVRGLSRPSADPDFRARLKRDFVSGALRETGRVAAPVRRPWRVRWSRVAPLAAAAAILFVMVVGNRGAPPRVIATSGEGTILVDGASFAANQTDEINRRLRPGAEIQLIGGAVVDVFYPGTMVWEFAAGSRFTLPRPPGRWYDRTIECALDFGESRVRTGPRFPGTRLTIDTPEGTTVLTGTLVSVYRDSSVTCVCVQEGTAMIGVDAGDLDAVGAGMRKIMFRDGRPPVITEIAPPHQQHLLEFDEKFGSVFGSSTGRAPSSP